MNLPSEAQPYLALANQLDQQPDRAPQLPSAVAPLPPLDLPLFTVLAELAAATAGSYPRRAWAIAAVAEAAAARLDDHHRRLKAQAAWHLARAANERVHPDLVDAALARARAGFAALQDQGWLAACAWQEHALPWTRNNFRHSAAVLAQAAAELEEAGLDNFAAGCRLSLAFAQAVLWQFEEAAHNVALAEAAFVAAGDEANQARCFLVRSSSLRRQSDFDAALACLAKAEATFRRLNLPLDLAKTYFQIGHCRWQRYNDPAAITAFQEAARIFHERDLLPWFAQCQGGLAEIYHYQGQLEAADQALALARAIYRRFPIYGLRADNLFESGTLVMLYGRYAASLNYFQQAESLYIQASVPYMAALVTMSQGEVYTRLGRYQQALRSLEQAHQTLETSGAAGRLIECEMRLAQLWLALDRPDLSLTYLETAAGHAQRTQQTAFLAELCYFRAEVFLRQQRYEAAIDMYQQAVIATERHGLLPEIAFARRLLGEALCFLDRPHEAGDHLQTAAAIFSQRGLMMELAVCQVALGRYYNQIGDTVAARTAWETAAARAQDVLPDASWQAAAGLAALAEAEGETAAALHWFDQLMQALSRVRRDFWQPSLIGRYLHRPLEAFDQAVRLAARQAPATTLLRFVEESKAQITAVQLAHTGWSAERSDAASTIRESLAHLKAEVEWLYEQETFKTKPLPGIRATQEAQALQQLKEKNRAYDTILARLERESLAGLPAGLPGRLFDLDDFRATANARLGRRWLALNYYLTGADITALLITPDDCITHHRPLNGPARLLLTALERGSQSGQSLEPAQLSTLGRTLLPPFIQEQLEPETHLLIAPHRQLHRLPWPTLQPGGPDSPHLVQHCIPVITPSLQTLHLLWQRHEDNPPAAGPGLLLALSEFAQGRRPPLPAVRDEAEQLKGQATLALLEAEATWANLLALRQENGLARFAFLHVASHAFADPVSGRASGISLYDQDIWLDQLWEIAPLPPLVTLSACSGAQSLTHQGDEHVGLVTTCLAAGANQVIGSLWPVLDPAAARLMTDFYHQYAAGRSPAAALAGAQRRQSSNPASWSGFLCLGLP